MAVLLVLSPMRYVASASSGTIYGTKHPRAASRGLPISEAVMLRPASSAAAAVKLAARGRLSAPATILTVFLNVNLTVYARVRLHEKRLHGGGG